MTAATNIGETTMSLEITEIETSFPQAIPNKISLLPSDFDCAPSSGRYHSNSLSFFKHSGAALCLSFLNEPTTLLEQRSGEWFAPAMLITSQFMASHPNVVSIACNLVSSYIYDIFKGTKQPKVRMTVLCEKRGTSKIVRIDYAGDVEGLGTVQAAIEKALK